MDIVTELNFKIIEEIGNEGLNSKTYKAYDPQLNATIAVKEIKKSTFENPSKYFSESKILYNTPHPNIMEIHYASQDNDNIYFSMPFCDKSSLNYLINQKFLTVREIIKYSLEFLSGLHFIHTKKLIHFDVKPSNIMISNSNKALLSDFGLTQYADSDGFASIDKVYPTHWVPEFFTTAELTSQYDIYQTGLTLYRLCNGNDEFHLQSKKVNNASDIQKEIFPDRTHFLPHIPKELKKCIKGCLKANPDKRYKTILDVINKLSEVDANLDVQYEKNSDTELWMLEKDKTIKKLLLISHDSEWQTEGYTLNKTNGKTNRNTKIFGTYKSKKEAYNKLEGHILEL